VISSCQDAPLSVVNTIFQQSLAAMAYCAWEAMPYTFGKGWDVENESPPSDVVWMDVRSEKYPRSTVAKENFTQNNPRSSFETFQVIPLSAVFKNPLPVSRYPT